jgi:hypothetical protein
MIHFQVNLICIGTTKTECATIQKMPTVRSRRSIETEWRWGGTLSKKSRNCTFKVTSKWLTFLCNISLNFQMFEYKPVLLFHYLFSPKDCFRFSECHPMISKKLVFFDWRISWNIHRYVYSRGMLGVHVIFWDFFFFRIQPRIFRKLLQKYSMHTGVQSKNNAYHNVNKVKNQSIYALFLLCTPA